MIVGFDEDRGMIWIEGVPKLFPARSLIVSAQGDLISIFFFDGEVRVFGPDHYSIIQQADGTHMQNATQALNYLNGIFNRDQKTKVVQWVSPYAMTTWSIQHNFGYFPRVSVVDTAGTEIWPDVTNLDLNTLTINFAYPVSGTAYLI